ncbi:hypothetical protein ACFS27_22815 [Promicromonospora vindobonensis]|uniref:Uncharacterized protein n=1 Tax=Promicromonospora vindobonensis TaxID=195748 RepID=A0ABW5VYM2_9MICO
MALDAKDRAFRYDGISRVDYKSLNMDRVLTAFLGRLNWSGAPSVMSRASDLNVDDYTWILLNDVERFRGFGDDEDVTRRWVSTHLLDLVNRGRSTEQVAGPRPLHGYAYRLRNSRRSRPYGADEQLYEMLSAKQPAIDALRNFFFTEQAGADAGGAADIDVESQALLSMVEATKNQAKDRGEPATRKPLQMLCRQPAETMADDVMRLLLHRHFMPRTVLVEHLKVLLSFHLALYHLRMIKLVPRAVREAGVSPSCTRGHPRGETCPYAVNLFADVVGDPMSPVAMLANRSASVWYGRVPQFVRGTFALLKLADFAEDLRRRNKPLPGTGRSELAAVDVASLLTKKYEREREGFFDMRVRRILDDEEKDQPLGPELKTILDLGLNSFDTYLELIMHYRGRFQRKYLMECLDSLLMKGRPGQLVAQPRGTRAERRFVLDSRLLEVLLQVSLVRPDERGVTRTHPMRVDEVLAVLRNRYGIFIDELPSADGFEGADLADQAVLRTNGVAFVDRLREIGYYRDLSDAYLTQTVTPRYVIGSPIEGSSR